MNPAPSDVASYWSSGGEVLGRNGALTDRRATALLRFYGRRARGCGAKPDGDGARFCARMALQLAAAMAAADAWRRAASGARRFASPCGELGDASLHLGPTTL